MNETQSIRFANNFSDKPFFTKLGFFTKKGYVLYLSYFLFVDYIYVLIFGKLLQTLNQIIADIEGILTWPFNYNHLTTLLIGLIFPFLPLIFELLLLT